MRKIIGLILLLTVFLGIKNGNTQGLYAITNVELENISDDRFDDLNNYKSNFINQIVTSTRSTSVKATNNSSNLSLLQTVGNVTIFSTEVFRSPSAMHKVEGEVVLSSKLIGSDVSISSVTVPLQGVGRSQNQAFINMYRSVNKRDLKNYFEKLNEETNAFLNQQCNSIISNAKIESNQGNFDEALYALNLIPESSGECYDKAEVAIVEIYEIQQEFVCEENLSTLKLQYSKSNSIDNSVDVLDTAREMDFNYYCQERMQEFYSEVENNIERQNELLAQELKEKRERAEEEKRLKAEEDALQREREYNLRLLEISHNRSLEELRIKSRAQVQTENMNTFTQALFSRGNMVKDRMANDDNSRQILARIFN